MVTSNGDIPINEQSPPNVKTPAFDVSTFDPYAKPRPKEVPEPAVPNKQQMVPVRHHAGSHQPHINPLLRYSLRGSEAELDALAANCRPLLDDVCRSGQSTVWYAPPNNGKTLIAMALVLDAIRQNRIEGDKVCYVNADDNPEGIRQKLTLMTDVGAHMLCPGFKDFVAADLAMKLEQMAIEGTAEGAFVVIDTLKKFTSLMDKKESSAFAAVCRRFVARGGTILGLAHTNKNAGANGKAVYSGTTDLIEDFDAAYMLAKHEVEQRSNDQVVMFDCIKKRGDSPERCAYSYSTENGLTYHQLVASVEQVSFDAMGQIDRAYQEREDGEIIYGIQTCIADGIVTKMAIAVEVAKQVKAGRKAVMKVIDRYTGPDPAIHHWDYMVGARGAHEYRLHDGAVCVAPDGP